MAVTWFKVLFFQSWRLIYECKLLGGQPVLCFFIQELHTMLDSVPVCQLMAHTGSWSRGGGVGAWQVSGSLARPWEMAALPLYVPIAEGTWKQSEPPLLHLKCIQTTVILKSLSHQVCLTLVLWRGKPWFSRCKHSGNVCFELLWAPESTPKFWLKFQVLGGEGCFRIKPRG